MLRFLARFLGFWIVAAALVAAIVDGAKSIAASAFVVTPVAETWATLAAKVGASAPDDMTAAVAEPFATGLDWFLNVPTVVVLTVLGVALLIAGAKRRRPTIGREFGLP